jgi:hypothetical protein
MEKSASTNSYRTTPENKAKLTTLWGSVYKGTNRAVEAYLRLRPRVLQALKGMFTRGELSLLATLQKETGFQPETATQPRILSARLEDVLKYETYGSYGQVEERWDITITELFSKIEALSAIQTYFLLEEIARFSSEGEHTQEELLNEYCYR